MFGCGTRMLHFKSCDWMVSKHPEQSKLRRQYLLANIVHEDLSHHTVIVSRNNNLWRLTYQTELDNKMSKIFVLHYFVSRSCGGLCCRLYPGGWCPLLCCEGRELSLVYPNTPRRIADTPRSSTICTEKKRNEPLWNENWGNLPWNVCERVMTEHSWLLHAKLNLWHSFFL